MTLLEPLKYITALNLPKLSNYIDTLGLHVAQDDATLAAPAASPLEHSQPKTPVSAPDPLPSTPSEILQQIGTNLRRLREERQLSIDDMSARTQIQPRLIQAIEEGRIEALPEPVYVKGMVKRYGDSLGLDGSTISQQVPIWKEEAPTFTTISSQTKGFNTPTVKPLHVYLGYTLALFGIGAGTSHVLNNTIKPPSRSIPSTAIQPHRTARTAVAPRVTAPQPAQFPGVQIGISVKKPIWAQIGIDGTTKFTGNLQVGTQFSWIAKKQVTISTNNAGGLLLSRDPLTATSTARSIPQPLGKIGQKQNVTIKVGN